MTTAWVLALSRSWALAVRTLIVSAVLGPAGIPFDQSALVGEHDRLDSVAEVRLGEDAGAGRDAVGELVRGRGQPPGCAPRMPSTSAAVQRSTTAPRPTLRRTSIAAPTRPAACPSCEAASGGGVRHASSPASWWRSGASSCSPARATAGIPADAVAAVIHLATAASRLVTGTVLTVDGGWTAQ